MFKHKPFGLPPLLRMALQSLWNRRTTAALTIASIAIGVALLLCVRQIAHQTRDGFSRTVSGTDLIVGARGGQINLLLYSVFRIGDATNNISYETFQKLAMHRDVAWAIPLSLGDSHRGYRVLGTNADYFSHYQYGDSQSLRLTKGSLLNNLHDTVLGSEVARSLSYQIGDHIVLSHGIADVSFTKHDDQPFKVSGILAPTGTPVDRTVHVSLEAIEAIHVGSESSSKQTADATHDPTLIPKTVTAIMLGLKSRLTTFELQRSINDYRGEPLLAILPGVTLSQLWKILSVVETALTLIGSCVVIACMIGLLTALLTTLNERRREISILRSVGARPRQLFLLLIGESGLLGVLGIVIGVIIFYSLLIGSRAWALSRFGIDLQPRLLTGSDIILLVAIMLMAFSLGTIPAWQAYRRSLSDGLALRV
jgi:putative ABC transport system permease protein